MGPVIVYWYSLFCFFFQAEDGIRDRTVTGVQTCALPIWPSGRSGPWRPSRRRRGTGRWASGRAATARRGACARRARRRGVWGSEERRGGKEGRVGWWGWRWVRKRGRGAVVVDRGGWHGGV